MPNWRSKRQLRQVERQIQKHWQRWKRNIRVRYRYWRRGSEKYKLRILRSRLKSSWLLSRAKGSRAAAPFQEVFHQRFLALVMMAKFKSWGPSWVKRQMKSFNYKKIKKSWSWSLKTWSSRISHYNKKIETAMLIIRHQATYWDRSKVKKEKWKTREEIWIYL